MRIKPFIPSSAGLILSAILLLEAHAPLTKGRARGTVRGTVAGRGMKLRVSENYGKLPLSFEPNQGQASSEVKFLARGSGYTLFPSSTDALLYLRKTNAQPVADRRWNTSSR